MRVSGSAVYRARELLQVRFEAGLMLAEQSSGTSLPVGVAVTLALVVAVVALLGRRRMPAGLGEGAFVSAVSGAALLVLAVDSAGSFSGPALGHVLTALSVFWYVLSRIGEVGRPSGWPRRASTTENDDACERLEVLAYAALVCGLAALVICLYRPAGLGMADWLAAAIDLVVLLALSVAAGLIRADSSGAYPAVTVLAGLLVLAVGCDGLETHATACGVGMNIAAALALLVVVGKVVLRWWRRRHQWLEDPQRVARAPLASDRLFTLLVGVSLLVGIGGVLLREAALAPSAVLLAAATCLTIGHLRGWLLAGEVGLILVGESIVVGSLAWLRPGWAGALFGLGLAGIYLLWLARFWDQQLEDGVPWTTAGRLIPSARRLAYAAGAGAVAATVGGFGSGDSQVQPGWLAAITAVVLLGSMVLLVRDAYEHRRSGGALAACLVVVAAAGPGCRLLSGLLGAAVSPVVGIAGGGLLLAVRAAVMPRTPPAATVYNAFIGGILPVIALFTLAWRGLDAQSAMGLVMTVAAMSLGLARVGAEPLGGRVRQPGRS